jgi:hypothetical protein
VLYWFDIVLDIVLLHEVLAGGGSLGYALLLVMVAHYVVMAQLVAWRCVEGRPARRLLAALVALPLVPLVPLLDTATFVVVTALHMFEGAPAFLAHHSWVAEVEARSEEWVALFDTREVLEVVLEAVPTAVLQSVVFVAGNSPRLGIYLDTTLYLLSSAGSCAQILRLAALVLWAAAQQRAGVWRVLSGRLLSSVRAGGGTMREEKATAANVRQADSLLPPSWQASAQPHV